jgi:hypothetical protein
VSFKVTRNRMSASSSARRTVAILPPGCSDAAGAKSAPAPVSFATWAAAAAQHYV